MTLEEQLRKVGSRAGPKVRVPAAAGATALPTFRSEPPTELRGPGCVSPAQEALPSATASPLACQQQGGSEPKVKVSESQDYRLYTHSNLLL